METIYILSVIYRLDDTLLRDMSRERQLHYEPIHIRIGIETCYRVKQLLLGHILLITDKSGLEPAHFASLDLVCHISFRTAVMSYKNGGKMRATHSCGNHVVNFGRYLAFDVIGHFLSVDKSHISQV